MPVFGPLSETLTRATPLILGGLSVSVAFRAGLFNIGGQGQILAGAGCAGYVGFAWHLPAGLHVVVCLLAAALGGAIWGGIAGVLKALTGAHEVIATIMLNYIAVYLLTYVLTLPGYQLPHQNDAISRPGRLQRAAAAPVRRPPAGQRRAAASRSRRPSPAGGC